MSQTLRGEDESARKHYQTLAEPRKTRSQVMSSQASVIKSNKAAVPKEQGTLSIPKNNRDKGHYAWQPGSSSAPIRICKIPLLL